MFDFSPNTPQTSAAGNSENLLQAGHPSLTALQVATLRAVHQLLDEPIVFDDPLALPILGAQHEAALREDPFQYNDPMPRYLRASLAVRSRLAEDELALSVRDGVRQYVVLGAGLDTFAYRNPHGNALRTFEVDHPATQAWKREMLRNASIAVPDNLAYAPLDFTRSTLPEALRSAGFRDDLPAFFSWLGVTMYLESATIFDTLRYVGSLPSGSGILFDYRLKTDRMTPLEAMVMEQMGQRVAEHGEPWKSAFDPSLLAQELHTLGFHALEDRGPDELNARYLARRKDGLRKAGGFRLMCARI